jgi:hypothetical protein
MKAGDDLAFGGPEPSPRKYVDHLLGLRCGENDDRMSGNGSM